MQLEELDRAHLIHPVTEFREREGLVENSATVGAYLLAQLRATFGDDPTAGDIRGVGMMNAVEWVKPGTKEPAGVAPMEYAAAISTEAKRRGLIVRPLWECTAIAPPLCATRADIDEIVGLLAETVKAVQRGSTGVGGRAS